jgi:hypothetical protein
MLSNVSSKLGNFKLILELSLEARKHDFSLRGLEPVNKMWYRPNVICL